MSWMLQSNTSLTEDNKANVKTIAALQESQELSANVSLTHYAA